MHNKCIFSIYMLQSIVFMKDMHSSCCVHFGRDSSHGRGGSNGAVSGLRSGDGASYCPPPAGALLVWRCCCCWCCRCRGTAGFFSAPTVSARLTIKMPAVGWKPLDSPSFPSRVIPVSKHELYEEAANELYYGSDFVLNFQNSSLVGRPSSIDFGGSTPAGPRVCADQRLRCLQPLRVDRLGRGWCGASQHFI